MGTESVLQELTDRAQEVDPVSNARLCAAIEYSGTFYFGINEYKTHPLQARFRRNKDSIYLHAEISAIANASSELHLNEFAQSRLYVVRMKTDPQTGKEIWGLSKPCLGCQRAIVAFEIPWICYTTGPNKYRIISK